VARVVERSKARVDPPCPYFGTCGGCTLQHIAYETQVEDKAIALLESLRRIARIDPASVVFDPPWYGSAYGYRTRARFAIGRNGEVGYRALEERTIVDVKSCAILSPPMARALEAIRNDAKKPAHEIEAVANDAEVRIAGLGPDDPIDARDAFGPLFLLPDVFAQSNRAGNAAMCAYIEARLRKPIEEAIELYSGSGNFTRVLANHASRVRALESDPRAVALAERVRPPNVEIIGGDVEAGLRTVPSSRVDLLFVDPPRAGMSKAALELAANLRPRDVLYVSCDPATFARDVARFATLGLVLERARLFDLYPQTAHAEVIGSFSS
jgi:23S rRNA (uracil1939-C5)-methyltransferase